ncbi:hypothetical protein L596_008768 [Steinernema carpocapsae]|uniref:G-protein coupled receptors family 1 profile domain-containing protein n=1 Tax=Steinernema carpocapsae TaxID=34508 RepID=A0A4U5PDJ1_STECR|nr:hypothetical protein L596_008768 [Steinernema carpocapsae]
MGYKAVVNFYSSYVLPYLFFLICLLLIALNIAALVYHLRRTKDASRYGTLFILLLTHIATAVLFLASFIPALILEINSNLFHVRWIFVLIVYLHDLLGRVRLMLTPVSSCFLALDRIFALTFPFKYAQNKVSRKFAAVAGVLNLFILFLHLLPILPFHYEPLLNLAEMLLETFALFHVPVGLMFMELLIYALFCIRYGSAVKKQANYTEKRSLVTFFLELISFNLFSDQSNCSVPDGYSYSFLPLPKYFALAGRWISCSFKSDNGDCNFSRRV